MVEISTGVVLAGITITLAINRIEIALISGIS